MSLNLEYIRFGLLMMDIKQNIKMKVEKIFEELVEEFFCLFELSFFS